MTQTNTIIIGAGQAGLAMSAALSRLGQPHTILERGRIAASDGRLMDGPLGLAGQRCVATLFLAAGSDLPQELVSSEASVRHSNGQRHDRRVG